MDRDTTQQSVGRAMREGGWSHAGSFLASILSGMLLGLLADYWLGTEPWLVVIGSLAGIYAGFVNVWKDMKRTEEGPQR
jgi:F0F1-type ATP synthase assembly protein I